MIFQNSKPPTQTTSPQQVEPMKTRKKTRNQKPKWWNKNESGIDNVDLKLLVAIQIQEA